MKTVYFAIAVACLAACEPAVPDSGAGVGFGDYNTYEANRLNREAQLQGRPAATVVAAQPQTVQPEGATVPTPTNAPLSAIPEANTGAVSTNDLAAAGIGATTPTSPAVAGTAFEHRRWRRTRRSIACKRGSEPRSESWRHFR